MRFLGEILPWQEYVVEHDMKKCSTHGGLTKESDPNPYFIEDPIMFKIISVYAIEIAKKSSIAHRP